MPAPARVAVLAFMSTLLVKPWPRVWSVRDPAAGGPAAGRVMFVSQAVVDGHPLGSQPPRPPAVTVVVVCIRSAPAHGWIEGRRVSAVGVHRPAAAVGVHSQPLAGAKPARRVHPPFLPLGLISLPSPARTRVCVVMVCSLAGQPSGSSPAPRPARTVVGVFMVSAPRSVAVGVDADPVAGADARDGGHPGLSWSAVGIDRAAVAGTHGGGRAHPAPPWLWSGGPPLGSIDDPAPARTCDAAVIPSPRRWGPAPHLCRRGCACSRSSSSPGGPAQPLGSIAGPWAARTRVDVVMVVSPVIPRGLCRTRRRRAGSWWWSWRFSRCGCQPLGSIPDPWPAWMRVCAFIASSGRRQPFGSMNEPAPARVLVVVFMVLVLASGVGDRLLSRPGRSRSPGPRGWSWPCAWGLSLVSIAGWWSGRLRCRPRRKASSAAGVEGRAGAGVDRGGGVHRRSPAVWVDGGRAAGGCRPRGRRGRIPLPFTR